MDGKSLRVAIIGAGPAGIAAAIRLQEQGVTDLVLFDKNADVGGTWQINRYPGLTCDVPAHLYRFSFAPNPDWSRRYAPRAEILDYIKGMAEKHGIPGKVRYSEEVTAATYEDGRWHIETNRGDAGVFDAVITAVGVLHHPVYPGISGIEHFEGVVVHPSRWDESMPIEGKRVGIIGSGSTAVQIIGAIVDTVEKVTLFQRTAQWIMPEDNPEIPEGLRERYRNDPEYLDRRYKDLFEKFMAGFGGAVTDTSSEAYALVNRMCRENLANSVKSDELRRKLTPNYEVGCKRLVVSTTFYDAIQSPNAELVTERIERIEKQGVRTADGKRHELNILVTATGFDAHHYFGSMRITGKGGISLDEAWSNYQRAYRAVTVPGFPNWFMIGGPTTPVGNFPYFKAVEHQLGYILHLVARLQSGEARAIEPRGEPTDAYNELLLADASNTLWASGCKSWYLSDDGKVRMYPWPFERFQSDMSEPIYADFDLG